MWVLCFFALLTGGSTGSTSLGSAGTYQDELPVNEGQFVNGLNLFWCKNLLKLHSIGHTKAEIVSSIWLSSNC